MEKYVFLKVIEKKGRIFFSKNNCFDCGDYFLAEIEPKKRALNLLKREFPFNKIFLIKDSVNCDLFEKIISPVNVYTYKYVIPFMEEIVRQMSDKFDLKIPLREIFIVAPERVACEIIFAVKNLSVLFTVVSKNEADDKILKEFYLDYALPIRHQKSFPSQISDGTIAISLENSEEIQQLSMPVLNLSDKKCYAENVINARSIFLSDENIRRYASALNVKSGAELYSLFKIRPQAEICANINKSADLIFSLDMGTF